MATKHSPQIELSAARREYDTACEQCPHWDYCGDNVHMGDECCYRVDDARRRYRKAQSKAQ